MAKQSTFRRINGSLHAQPTRQSAHPAALMTSPWSPPSLIKIQGDEKLTLLRKLSFLLKLTPFSAFALAIPSRMTSLYGWGTREESSQLGVHIMWPSYWSRQIMRVKARLATPRLYYGRRCGISTFLKRLEFLLGEHA